MGCLYWLCLCFFFFFFFLCGMVILYFSCVSCFYLKSDVNLKFFNKF